MGAAVVSEAVVNEAVNACGRDVIVGIGTTGLSCARYLCAQGIEPLLFDTRKAPPALQRVRELLPAAACVCGPIPADALRAAKRIIVSPGVPLDHPALAAARANSVEIIGDIELFARAASAPIIAITGSNGKSTVTTLVTDILRGAGQRVLAGANLGTPALALLAEESPDYYVLELSSFQLELTRKLQAHCACLLNVSADHIDRHQNLAAYAAAKARVLDGADIMVLNLDDPLVRQAQRRYGKTLGVSLTGAREADYGLISQRGESWLCCGAAPLLCATELHLPGRHNLYNALAAVAITDALGVARATQMQVLRNFTGLPHRCELIAERADVRWYDDSKATNVGAAVAAIEAVFEGRSGVLIAGGMGKGADFAPLGAALHERVHTVVLIGVDAPRIAAVVPQALAVIEASDLSAAVAHAADVVRPGEAVLLSPACASLDMFSDFAARGKAYQRAVNEVLER